MSQKIPLHHSVEALAASAAVQFAKDFCIHKIESEGDSLLVISALRDSRPSFTLYGHIIEETKLLASSLQWFNFKHVKREGNCLDVCVKKLSESCITKYFKFKKFAYLFLKKKKKLHK